MRRKLSHNPQFWLSVALTFVLAGIWIYRAAFAQPTRWQPPTEPPPDGQPASPIDTSRVGQEKTGDLTITEGTLGARRDVDIGKGIARAITLDVSIVPQILVWDGNQTQVAAIRLWNGKLQARHTPEAGGEWFDLGSGGVWKEAGTGRIRYDGFVGIGTVNPISQLHLNGFGFQKGLTLTASGSQSGRLWIDASGNVHLGTSHREEDGLTLFDNGNVLISTSNGTPPGSGPLILFVGDPKLPQDVSKSVRTGKIDAQLTETQSVVFRDLESPAQGPRGAFAEGHQAYLLFGGWFDTGPGAQCAGNWGDATKTDNQCVCEAGQSLPNPGSHSNVPIYCVYP